MSSEFKSKASTLKKKINRLCGDIKVIYDEGQFALKDNSRVTSFRGMHSNLSKLYDRLEDTWDQMVELYEAEKDAPKFPSAEEEKILIQAKGHFYKANSDFITIQDWLEKAKAGEAAASAQQSSSGVPVGQNVTLSDSSILSTSHLPRLNLPSFDGRITNWPHFKDAYVSIVHEDPKIDPIRKFHYLISSVSGPAHAIVSKVALTANNYPIAWKALLDAYDKKRLLASAYLNELLNFKPIQGNRTSISALQIFLSQICENISAFNMLGLPDKAGFILFHLAIKCVDHQTRELFEMASSDKEFPSFDDLTQFVRNRCLALQLADQNYSDSNIQNSKSSSNTTGHQQSISKPRTSLLANEVKSKGSVSNQSVCCFVCKENHVLMSCPTFKESSPVKRRELLKSWKGCWNCLSYKHDTDHCHSRYHCRLCNVRHHTDLHVSKSEKLNSPSSSKESKVNLNSTSTFDSSVLLGTAVVQVQDIRGYFRNVRFVVDSGSQNSYLTNRCLNKLGLPSKRVTRKISCIGDTMFEGIKGSVSLKIRPRNTDQPELLTEALVVRQITCDLPNFTIPNEMWEPYTKFELADPKFWEQRPVDGLLGCDVFSDIFTGRIVSLDNEGPRLFDSIYGHLVLGKVPANDVDRISTLQCPTNLYSANQPDLRDELQRFWELEEISKPMKILSIDDELAEQHFVNTHYRTSSGRYVVYLPFKQPEPNFGPSYRQSLRRLLNLEDKFRKNPDLSQQYHDFMKEYEDLGHMTTTSTPSKYVIPHHAVSKTDRDILKLRVVFDGSAQTTIGSLNDLLHTGPKLQKDIREILMCFRIHPVVFVADCVKMFRQILVDPSHRVYQHVLWRKTPSDKVETYELNTITYGLSCSPYLALRVMQQLKADHGHEFPLAADVLCRDMFVDDFPTGASTVEEALELQSQLIRLLAKGGFSLSKWASNRHELLEAVSSQSANVPVDISAKEPSNIKVLGLQWDPQTDCFSYKIQVPAIVNTKRSIASNVAKIYDPLGFLSPVVISAKAFLQELWKEELGWDDPIPESTRTKWAEFVNGLSSLSAIKIPRFIYTAQPFQYQIIGFSDASELAYSATIYIRVLVDNRIRTCLLLGRSKLAPIKKLTVPRLELCGAHLLALSMTAIEKFTERLPKPSLPPIFFTDSTIVLGRLNTPTYKLKTYVANRITEILDVTSIQSWRHVKSEENPSDCSSRGIRHSDLISHSLWWNGPSWLTQPISCWPSHPYDVEHELPEVKIVNNDPTSLALLTSNPINKLDWMKVFSSYTRLLHFVATIRRFIFNHRHRDQPKFGPPDVTELESAEFSIIKAIQLQYFCEGKESNLSKILQRFDKLSPFIDQHGLIRVGGRLTHSDLKPHQKFPVLLPHHAHFTNIVVDFIHQSYYHPGPNLLQALTQLRYWVPSLRKLVKRRIFLCLRCFKAKADTIDTSPKMGDLPRFRITPGRTFQHTGTDFMGPLEIRESLKRKASVSKVWVCLFVCMRTKALHIEAVTGLSTEAFLACLSRFISRRGLPEEIFSDCGTNYRGAARQLQEFYQWFLKDEHQNKFLQFCTLRSIKWNFNPPHAPHFGGIWEAGVKSIKSHLQHVSGNAKLTFEELQTFLYQIEAILNSRPLCPLSSSPDEIGYLSPGHFLIGGPLVATPEPTLLDVPLNRLSRWQVVKQMTEHLWRRWSREYLTTLQQRAKWVKNKKDLAEGDLVLLRFKTTPPLSWPVGKVVSTHPGADGTIRVVTVRTHNNSVFQRPVVDVVPLLPLAEEPYGISS